MNDNISCICPLSGKSSAVIKLKTWEQYCVKIIRKLILNIFLAVIKYREDIIIVSIKYEKKNIMHFMKKKNIYKLEEY